MSERRDTSPQVSRLFIPEREFWTPEAAEIYLDDDGRLNFNPDGTPNFKPLDVPLIDADKFPIVDIPALVQSLDSLFVPDSPFPRIYKKDIEERLEEEGVEYSNDDDGYIRTGDNVDHVQEQKFYRLQRRVVDMAAYKFCDLSERKMRIPWLVHNVKTNIYNDVPAITDQKFMDDHVTGAVWSLAMLEAAVMMERRGHGFSARKKSLSSDEVMPNSPMEIRTRVDITAAEHFREMSQKVKDVYRASLWLYAEKVPPESYFGQFVEQVTNSRPKGVIGILGQVATHDPWDYSPFLRGKLTMEQARNTQRNRHARRVIRESRLVA
jgi:hypothetical protein